MQQDIKVVRWDWFRILNSLTWQEVLRRYLIRSKNLLGKDYDAYDFLSQAVAHLSKRNYVTLPIEAKVAILRVLVDDMCSHPEIVEAIDSKVGEREELHKAKWTEEWEDRKSTKDLLLVQRYLSRGEAPPHVTEGADVEDDIEKINDNQDSIVKDVIGEVKEKKKKKQSKDNDLPSGIKLEKGIIETRKKFVDSRFFFLEDS